MLVVDEGTTHDFYLASYWSDTVRGAVILLRLRNRLRGRMCSPIVLIVCRHAGVVSGL